MKQKYTSGPWRWELNEKSKTVQLAGGKPMYDKTVMDFVRYGMGSAAPRFNEAADSGYNFMKRCEKFGKAAEGREHHTSWFKEIAHPDACLISAAPELLEALIELLDTVEALNDLDPMASRSDEIQQAKRAIAKALGNGIL